MEVVIPVSALRAKNTMVFLNVTVALLLSGIVLIAKSEMSSELTCSPKSSNTHVTVNTQRSTNGNWVTKVALERGGGRGQMDAMWTEPWLLDVNSSTRTCEGAESTLHVTLTLTAPLPKLSPDYELFPGIGYYKFHTDATTCPLARQKCAEEGAHLAILNSETEANVMMKLFDRHPKVDAGEDATCAWIGVQRKDGEYFTIFGDAFSTTGFTRWCPGEPQKRAGEDCLAVRQPDGCLVDAHTPWKIAFICEHEL